MIPIIATALANELRDIWTPTDEDYTRAAERVVAILADRDALKEDGQ